MTDTLPKELDPKLTERTLFRLTHGIDNKQYWIFRIAGDRVDLRTKDDKAVALNFLCADGAALRFALTSAKSEGDVARAVAYYMPGFRAVAFVP